jgi:hypothetical protein
MQSKFDLYLVSVEWSGKGQVCTFTASKTPLEAIDEESSSNKLVYEIPMYQKNGAHYYQIAVESKDCPF